MRIADKMSGKEPLQVSVLGNLAVQRHRTRIELPPSKKTRALLAYLVVTARPHSRDRLCAMFWPVPDDPRAALRWSLSLSLIHISEPTRLLSISYAVFCLKKKKKT